MKIGSRSKFLIKFAVSFGLVLYLVFAIDWSGVRDSLLRADPLLLLLGYALSLGILYLQAWRWRILLHIPDLPITKYLHFVFVGIFYRLFLPGSLSADLLKVVLFGRKYDKPLHESGLVVFSQFLGLAMQWIVGIFGLYYFGSELLQAFHGAEFSWGKLVGAGLAAAALIATLAMVPALRAFVWRLAASVRTAVRTPKVIGPAVAVTAAIQVLMVASAWCIFQGVGIEMPLFFLCLQMAIVNSFLLLPVSVNGIGVVEYLNIFLIQTVLGYPPHQIIAVSAVSYSFWALNAFLGGGWILWRNVTDARGAVTD